MDKPFGNEQDRISTVGRPREQPTEPAVHDTDRARGKEEETAVSAAQRGEISQGGEEDVGQHTDLQDADHGRSRDGQIPLAACAGQALADSPKSIQATAPTDDQRTNVEPGFDKARNGLLQEHADLLTRYGIGIKTQQTRGYRSVTDRAELARLGFSAEQCRVPSLVSPILDVRGKKVSHQIQPDRPRLRDGTPLTYEVPQGSHLAIDFPAPVAAAINDPAVPLFIVDSVMKADAAADKGICCAALLGDWCWSRKDESGKSQPLPGWSDIKLGGREVFLVVDSDFVANLAIYSKLLGLNDYLETEGAQASFVYLPPGENGQRMGIHDFLNNGHTVLDLLRLAGPLRPPSYCPYRMTTEGIFYDKFEGGRPIPVPLTNFPVEIVGDVRVEDGVEVRRYFELEATVCGEVTTFLVPAGELSDLTWVLTELGPKATVYPRREQDARAAIQLLSRRIKHRRVITHPGWIKNGDEDGYAHAGGIIWASPASTKDGAGRDRPSPNSGSTNSLDAAGPVGPVGPGDVRRLARHEITADLSERSTALCRLPRPRSRKQSVEAFKAVLRFLELGGHVTILLIAAVFRAALGYARFSIHLSGPSGIFKSEVAALAQQFWGAVLDASPFLGNSPSTHFLGNWSSTANKLEEQLFEAKDMLIVFDEFVAPDTPGGRSDLHRKADRIFRAQGNCSNRGRLRLGGNAVPEKRPRGLLLSTGEMIPSGLSLLARVLVVALSNRTIPEDRLTGCQADAAKGLYAEAMAFFVHTVASRKAWREKLWTKLLPHCLDECREEASRTRRHRRNPDILADLLLGFDAMPLRFLP